MRIRVRLTVGALATIAVAGSAAIPASAGSLHYYNSNGYENKLGSFTCQTSKVMHDVDDDKINSLKNETNCAFSARSWDWIPNTTIQIAYVSKGQSIRSFGEDNNEIDHFDRK